jgi:cytochrome c2
MPHARRLPLLLLPLLALSCSSRRDPPAGASGGEIYRLQNCANCHGDAREGTRLGPALRSLKAHWDPERLARYFADPRAMLAEDARLRALEQEYSGDMDRYDNLSLGQRRTLAWWLISNGE